MEKKMIKTLDIRTIAKIAMNTNNDNNDDNEDDVAIDFKKLYQNEKRKMKQQLQLQQQMVLQLQQQQEQEQEQEQDNDVNGINLSTQHIVTPNLSSQDLIDSINHYNINMEQTIYPEWVWNETYNTIVSTTSSSTPQHQLQLQTLKPNMIQYQQCFITNSIYRNELIRWLQQLPENIPLVSSSTSSSLSYSNTINNEYNANGKWTWLPHAQRRVALFCHHQHQVQQQILFPQPLQILIDQIMTMNLFPKQYQPNHILINEYQYSYQGILPHTDGPVYYPKTITISLGKSNVLLNFTPMIHNNNTNHISTNTNTIDYKSNESTSTNHTNIDIDDTTGNTNANNDSFQVVLHGDGSLIVFENDAYTNYYHSINDLSKQHQDNKYINNSGANDHVNNEKTNVTNSNASLIDEDTEVAGPNCLNATNGTCIHRYPNRISITIRHKYVT